MYNICNNIFILIYFDLRIENVNYCYRLWYNDK